jgi:hypothetical protein
LEIIGMLKQISKLTNSKWNGECRAATLIFSERRRVSKRRENDKRLISAHSRRRIRALQV